MTPGGDDEADDAKLTQSDYNRALQGDGAVRHDPVYVAFLTRLQRGGQQGQVLRYFRSNGCMRILVTNIVISVEHVDIIWLGQHIKGIDDYFRVGALLLLSNNVAVRARRERTNIPVCSRCGASRTFEMQVLSLCNSFFFVLYNTL